MSSHNQHATIHPFEEEHEESVVALAHDLERALRDLQHAGTSNERWKTHVDTFKTLRTADQAAIIQQISDEARAHLIADNKDSFDPDILSYLVDDVREDFLDLLAPGQIKKIFRSIENSEIVNIISSIEDEGKRSRLLAILSLRQRRVVEKNLAYPEDSVGRLMRQNYMAMPHEWSVGQALDAFRSERLRELSDDFYVLILIDELNRPVGIISVSTILKNYRVTKLRNLCEEDPVSIRADANQEYAANIFRRYGLVEAPVVDDSEEVIGTISAQEVFDIIEEEQEEDLLNLSGVNVDDFYQDVFSTLKSRIVWLLINLATAILASWVISRFTDQLEKAVTLAVLMPIVASMGGNAGTQTLAVAVRALATNQLTTTNTIRVLTKEAVVGLGNGALLGLLMAVMTWLWFGSGILPWIIAIAMVVNSMTAGVTGLLVPVILERLDWDPAVGSSIILTTFTDCVGFFVFLGLAALMI